MSLLLLFHNTTSVTWNSADYDSTDLTLGNGNLTITANNISAGGNWYAGARSTTSWSSGKYYFEILMNANTGNGGIGISTSSHSLNGSNTGSDTSLGYFIGDGSVFLNGLTLGHAASGTRLNYVGVAVDVTNKRIWFSVNGNPFIKDGIVIDITQTTPSDWFSFSALTGPFFATANTLSVGDYQTVNFGASAFSGPIPNGFTSWDGVQTLATQLFSPVSTWNEFDKSTTVTLSGNDLTATATTGDGTNANVRSTNGRQTGKYYFEIIEPTASERVETSGFGFANAAASLDSEYAGQTANSTGYFKNEGATGEVYFNNAIVATAGPSVSVLPQMWGVAVDITNGRWWVRVGTGAFIKGGNSIDITISTPSDWFSLPSAALSNIFVFLNLSYKDTWTVNFGASTFTGAIPLGFTSWDGTQPPKGNATVALHGVALTSANADVIRTWNPNDKSSNVLLSTDNLTVTDTTAGDSVVRANISKSAGKWYYEVTATVYTH